MHYLRSIIMGDLLRDGDGAGGGGAGSGEAGAGGGAGGAGAQPAPVAHGAGGGGSAALAAAAAKAAGAQATGDGNAPWYAATIPVEHHEVIKAKGWDGPGAVVESYTNLEKLLGAERAGRTVVLPNEKSTPEERAAFHAKIGVPEKADDYGIAVPEGTPDTFAKAAADQFKQLGIPKEAGSKLAAWWNSQNADAERAFQQSSADDMRNLQGEWGTGFADNVEAASRAARQLGWDKPTLDKLERAIGTGPLMKALHKVGGSMLEASNPRTGSDGSNNATFSLTKAGAQAKLEALKNDTAFQSRLHSPNAMVREPALKEWGDAHEAAAKG